MKEHGFKQQTMPKQQAEAKGVCIHARTAVIGFTWGDVAIVASNDYDLGMAFRRMTGTSMDVSLVQEISIFQRSDVKAAS